MAVPPMQGHYYASYARLPPPPAPIGCTPAATSTPYGPYFSNPGHPHAPQPAVYPGQWAPPRAPHLPVHPTFPPPMIQGMPQYPVQQPLPPQPAAMSPGPRPADRPPPAPVPEDVQSHKSKSKSEANVKAASIHSVQMNKSVHSYKPLPKPASKEHQEALGDFEERTTRQEYQDLARSTKSARKPNPPAPKSTSHQPPRSANPPSTAARSIIKPTTRQSPIINQEIHVNIHHNTPTSPPSPPRIHARTAAENRTEAIARADSLALARSIAASAATHAARGHVAVVPGSQKTASAKAASQVASAHTPSQPPTVGPRRQGQEASVAPSQQAKPAKPAKTPNPKPSSGSGKKSRSPTLAQVQANAAAAAAAAAATAPTGNLVEGWREKVRTGRGKGVEVKGEAKGHVRFRTGE